MYKAALVDEKGSYHTENERLAFIRGHQRFEMSRQNLEATTTELDNNQGRCHNYEVIAGLLLSCTTGSHIQLINFHLFCILHNTSWPLHEIKQKWSVGPVKDCIILECLFPSSGNWLNNHSRWSQKTSQNSVCGKETIWLRRSLWGQNGCWRVVCFWLYITYIIKIAQFTQFTFYNLWFV